ncbi:hypothetical protein [Alsobacter sp. SYSU BS001988]
MPPFSDASPFPARAFASPRGVAETVAYGRRVAAAQALASQTTAAQDAGAHHHGQGLKAAALVLLGGLAAGSIAFFASWLQPERPRLLAVTVGDAALSVRSPLVRDPGQRRDGAKPRLDLAVAWPSFEPAAPNVTRGGMMSLGDVVLVTILPADESPDPETRPAQLYGRYLDSAVEDGPGGLIQRRFRDKSPYAGETLFLAAPDGRRFAARCEGEKRTPDGLPDVCIAEIRRNGLDLQIRMEQPLLQHWEAIDARLRRLLDGMLG